MDSAGGAGCRAALFRAARGRVGERLERHRGRAPPIPDLRRADHLRFEFSPLAALPLPVGLRKILLHTAEQVVTGLRVFHDVKRFAGFTGFTVLIWCADAFSVTVSARALDLQLPFFVAALLLCGLGLGSAIPSTPG